MDEKATFHVIFLAENWTNGDWAAYTPLGNDTEKHVRLQPPTRVVEGHAVHGQLGLHHGNPEVIGHGQLVFNL